ncbi:hypothetical protein MMA84_23750, partial [Salmonella enterica]|nr:hypothetical protein [Salmonella enterica]
MFFQAQGAINALAATLKEGASLEDRFSSGAGATANIVAMVAVGFDLASSIGTLVSNEVSKRLMRQGAKLGLAAGIL